MAVRPPTRERLEQIHAVLAEQYTQPLPEMHNLEAVHALGATQWLEFRGVRYLVPPVPYKPGVQLDVLMLRMAKLAPKEGQEVTAESLTELGAVLMEMAALFHTLVRPVGWRRLVWRWTANPFRSASNAELKDLADFLGGCRRRSSVRHPLRPQMQHGST